MPDSDARKEARRRLKEAWGGDGADSQLTHAIADLAAVSHPADDVVVEMTRKLAAFLAEREIAEESSARGADIRAPQLADDPLRWAPAIQGKAFFEGEITADQLHQLPEESPFPLTSSGIGEVSAGTAYLAVALHPDDHELELNLDRLNDHLVAKERLEEAHARGGQPPQIIVLDTYARLARHPDDEALRHAAYTARQELATERDAVALLREYRGMAPRVVTGEPLVRRNATETAATPQAGGGTGRSATRGPSFPPTGPEASARRRTRRRGTLR